MIRPVLIALLLLPLGLAADEPPDDPAPPPPPIPEPQPPQVWDPDEEGEPEVIIRQDGDQTIEEYRRGGRLFMVRITPARGEPYYLIDTTGDGELDFRHDHMNPVKPAHWRVIEW